MPFSQRNLNKNAQIKIEAFRGKKMAINLSDLKEIVAQ
jgi:hypothetical protein